MQLEPVRLSVDAMRCRFELLVGHPDRREARAAAEEAVAEIARLGSSLNPHDPSSEVARLHQAGGQPVPLSPETWRLLQRGQLLAAATGHAFDITVGALLAAYADLKAGRTTDPPSAATVAAALAATGPAQLRLEPGSRTASLGHLATRLDLGAIGKGYAVDRAVELLQGYGCTALVHAGTSSVRAIGPAVTVGLADPRAAGRLLARRTLCHSALSVSTRTIQAPDGTASTRAHLIDPRTGALAEAATLAAVVAPDATTAEAWSTALLVDGPRLAAALRAAGLEALLLDPAGATVVLAGDWLPATPA
ncbi:MAG: FAD:protein FMN transferase [Fimbriimonadaceae bacterium]|nr:FAD:protein FMN transferase [Fimbriimonadaceae bacterium]